MPSNPAPEISEEQLREHKATLNGYKKKHPDSFSELVEYAKSKFEKNELKNFEKYFTKFAEETKLDNDKMKQLSDNVNMLKI